MQLLVTLAMVLFAEVAASAVDAQTANAEAAMQKMSVMLGSYSACVSTAVQRLAPLRKHEAEEAVVQEAFRACSKEEASFRRSWGKWLSGADVLRMETLFEALQLQLRDRALRTVVTTRAGSTAPEPF